MAKTMFSARLEEEQIEKIKTLSAELGMNQAELMDKMITVFEMSESKNMLKGLETDITDFESHLQSLQSAFLHLLELNANADNRIRSEFRNMLESKETIILDLQEQIQVTKELSNTKISENEELMKMVQRLSDENEELKTKIENCTQSLSDKQMIIESLKEKIPKENFEDDLKQKDELISSLQKKISDIEKQLVDEKKNYEYEVKVIEQQLEIELKQKLLTEKEKSQDKCEKQAEKIFQLQEQLNLLQKENFELKSQKEDVTKNIEMEKFDE